MHNQLSPRNKIHYGIGDLSKSAKDTCFTFFLFFYYTQILGLSASMAGLVALLALLADGISDPIIGQMSDNFRNGKWGRRHPFMIISTIPFCLSLVAIFNPPAELSQLHLFVWYLVFAIIVRTFLTLFAVPHMALGAELSSDYTERTSIMTYRTILFYGGNILIQVVAFFILIPTAIERGDLSEGYRQIGLVAAALALTGMTVSILGTKRNIPFLQQTTIAQQSRSWMHAFTDIFKLLKLHSARTFLLANVLIAIGIGMALTMVLHINTFFYGLSSEQMGIYMLSISLALPFASWLAMQGTYLLGKPKAIVRFALFSTLLTPLPLLAHLYGFTPPSGSNTLLSMLCIFNMVQQSFFIAYLTTTYAMVPDIADEVELLTGLRQEGILNSAMMLTGKVTFGLGTFLAGLSIDFAGFEGITVVEEITQDMLTRLAWTYSVIITSICLLGTYVFSHYRLDASRYEAIRASLDKRKALQQ
jgi:Na+/melibiose symporter-like transporter